MANSHLRRPAASRSTAKPSLSSIQKRNRQNRLSALPDDILLNILDRLDVRDAARTSILSKRWSHLSAKLSRLIINAQHFLPEGVSSDNISRDHLVQINAAALGLTKNILARRNPGEHTIRLLSTTFYLRDDVPISIGHVVANALKTHTVEEAEFTVLTEKERLHCTHDDVVNYGAQFVSFYNECLNAFTGLTRLHLQNLRFPQSDSISNILVTCKQLKYLGFVNCDTESRTGLQIEHAQLNELSFLDCRFGKVELKWLPRLTRTNYKCWMHTELVPLSFGDVPLLEVVSLSNVALSWHKMVKLSTLLLGTSVQDLCLGFKCEKIWVQPECPSKRLASVFHRLRIVNLVCIPEGYDLTWTMFILESAPSLQEFYMSVVDHPCEMELDKEVRSQVSYSEKKGVEWESPMSKFKHYHLKKLIIFCFESCMVSHVRCVMEAAVNLEHLYLYEMLACRKCQQLEALPTTFPLSKKHRCSTRKLLTKGVESRARIHFLHAAGMRADHAARIQ